MSNFSGAGSPGDAGSPGGGLSRSSSTSSSTSVSISLSRSKDDHGNTESFSFTEFPNTTRSDLPLPSMITNLEGIEESYPKEIIPSSSPSDSNTSTPNFSATPNAIEKTSSLGDSTGELVQIISSPHSESNFSTLSFFAMPNDDQDDLSSKSVQRELSTISAITESSIESQERSREREEERGKKGEGSGERVSATFEMRGVKLRLLQALKRVALSRDPHADWTIARISNVLLGTHEITSEHGR